MAQQLKTIVKDLKDIIDSTLEKGIEECPFGCIEDIYLSDRCGEVKKKQCFPMESDEKIRYGKNTVFLYVTHNWSGQAFVERKKHDRIPDTKYDQFKAKDADMMAEKVARCIERRGRRCPQIILVHAYYEM